MAGSQGQGRGRTNSLPSPVVDHLRAWLLHPDHIHHPYPTEQEKAQMIAETGIDMKRLNNWFVNSRIRIWKPKYEAMQKQQKQQNKGQKAPQHSSLAKHPSDCASDESFRRGITTESESKEAAQSLPRRVSLVSPSPPTKKIVHQVSDVSLYTSDVSSSSLSSDDGDDVSLPRAHKRPSLDIIAFSSPPRRQKRFRIVFEGVDLESYPSQQRYAQEDAEEWKQACLRSPRLDDQSLPTFDEATRLFGYSFEA